MPEMDSPKQSDSPKMRNAYAQLGLEHGAAMRDIEAAYWRFARELRGQPAMAAYTEAYETLVNSVAPRTNSTQAAPGAPAETPQKITPVSPSRGSKFGWPSN